jgi:hypothetical protein
VIHPFQDCEDYELGGNELVPMDFEKPGIFRTWHGAFTLFLAVALIAGAWTGVVCGVGLWK